MAYRRAGVINIVVTGIANLTFTFVAIYTVDRLGRRTLMLIGAGDLSPECCCRRYTYYYGKSMERAAVIPTYEVGKPEKALAYFNKRHDGQRLTK